MGRWFAALAGRSDVAEVGRVGVEVAGRRVGAQRGEWRESNPRGRLGVKTSTQSVSDAAGLLGAPAGARRMTVAARDLRGGDVVLAAVGLVVRSVDCFGGVCIVDFTDGTATAPVPAGGLVAIERETGGAS